MMRMLWQTWSTLKVESCAPHTPLPLIRYLNGCVRLGVVTHSRFDVMCKERWSIISTNVRDPIEDMYVLLHRNVPTKALRRFLVA